VLENILPGLNFYKFEKQFGQKGMRQNNFSENGRASVVITPTVYDKRGLTTTDPTSLAISLGNLNHLSSWYPNRISALLEQNGGIELLISRLMDLYKMKDKRSQLGFSCGLSCLSNLASSCGPRIRFRLVQAKIIPLLMPILEKACRLLNTGILAKEEKVSIFVNQNQGPMIMEPLLEHVPNSNLMDHSHTSIGPYQYQSPRYQFEEEKVKVQDLLMVITIIAYVSKYEATRNILHQHYPLYVLMELLTFPNIIPELRKWAITCMRNAVRNSNGIKRKRCGFIKCIMIKRSFEDKYVCNRCLVVSYCR
jgi:hypothetical protein